MPKTIILDSSCNILYASFYIKAFLDNSEYKIKFKSQPFKGLEHNHQYLALISKEVKEKKIIIDFGNLADISQKALDWCDVYGKVNLKAEDLEINKVVPIGPLTAINIFNPIRTIWYAFINLVRSVNRISSIKLFLGYYKAQMKRPKLEQYLNGSSTPNYIFFASSLWKKEKEANNIRANFIKVCRGLNHLVFEGGFAPRNKNDISGYEELTMEERLSYPTFLNQTKKSFLVFNTPSVGGCNGWKLAEYLYMGKAIISTQLVRVMPESFTEGKHYLITDGTIQDLELKVKKLTEDKELRKLLERNAKNYFEQVLSPEYVIKKLINYEPKSIEKYDKSESRSV